MKPLSNANRSPSVSMRSRRLLLLEDNVRDVGGHYLELATLLAEGARQVGYVPTLVVNRCFSTNGEAAADPRIEGLSVDPLFETRRMENWSLGVDGASALPRSAAGWPRRGDWSQRLSQTIRDYACRPDRGPRAMLQDWSRGFAEAIRRFRPEADDRIVINTGGDFQMLAMAHALDVLAPRQSLDIDVILHFAVFGDSIDAPAGYYGEQVNDALRRMAPHRVRLFATTAGLVEQLDAVGVAAEEIPYPTRSPDASTDGAGSSPSLPGDARPPFNVILAGMQRAEKGRAEIKGLLAEIEDDLIRREKIHWSMQLPSRYGRRVIPDSMHDLYANAMSSEPSPLGIRVGNVSSEAYHQWLDSADVGLFLYDARRYRVRCSGVLLEMLVRGKPVIVPSGCWMAEQVEQYSQSGPIGWVYESMAEIPAILRSLESSQDLVSANCRRVADRIGQWHSGANTLREMGIGQPLLDRKAS
ncbi:MAG: hypothetical protein AAFU85_13990 [Planctomycetota bacterium]